MQTRVLSCIVGGFVGVALTSTINDSMGLSPMYAFIVCAGVGVALGYVVSMLIDVFTAGPGATPSAQDPR